MTENVHSSYKITNNTLALTPSYRFDSSTLVYETNNNLYVKQPSLEMIKTACLDGFANYDGRREAAIQTGAKRKVPIAIYPNQDIYAFPTFTDTL
ncbi:competence protein ComK [Salipaludibacillus sp. CF4.18]|uniref:competence protein ComK n=1 Tax=Salipaludibacillus sp. CF4.18 TaxID=3373081 RepID=UPI003EE44BAE